MAEQLTLDGLEYTNETTDVINDIFRNTAEKTGYQLKYFTYQLNMQNIGKPDERVIGYSLLLDGFLFAKIKLLKKSPTFTALEIKDDLIDEADEIVSRKPISTLNGFSRVNLDNPERGKALLKAVTLRFAEAYVPTDSFGCCHLYEKCSDARHCLDDDKLRAKACFYRKNLESGRIFYGKNANI